MVAAGSLGVALGGIVGILASGDAEGSLVYHLTRSRSPARRPMAAPRCPSSVVVLPRSCSTTRSSSSSRAIGRRKVRALTPCSSSTTGTTTRLWMVWRRRSCDR